MGNIRKALCAFFFLVAALVGCSRSGEPGLISDEGQFVLRGTQVDPTQRADFERAVLGLEILGASDVIIGYCTAVLIRQDVILTAGHCFDPNFVKGVRSARVQTATNLSTVKATDPGARRVAKWIFHPQFDSRGVTKAGSRRPRYDHDLAIGILENPIDVSILPQQLISSSTPLLYGQRIMVYGFGRAVDYDESENSNVARRFLTLQRGTVRMSGEMINNRIVTHFYSPSLICSGDSGGPGFFLPKHPGAAPTIVTINSASRGPTRAGGVHPLCGGSSVMQPVAPSRDWIDRVLRENEQAIGR